MAPSGRVESVRGCRIQSLAGRERRCLTARTWAVPARTAGMNDNLRMNEDELRERVRETEEQIEDAEKRLEEVEAQIDEAREHASDED